MLRFRRYPPKSLYLTYFNYYLREGVRKDERFALHLAGIDGGGTWIMLVIGKKKMYGWCIALTFILYVFYDLANLLSLHISQDSLDILFFMATLSILWAIWNIFLEALGLRRFGHCAFSLDILGKGSLLKKGTRCQGDDLQSLHLPRPDDEDMALQLSGVVAGGPGELCRTL